MRRCSRCSSARASWWRASPAWAGSPTTSPGRCCSGTSTASRSCSSSPSWRSCSGSTSTAGDPLPQLVEVVRDLGDLHGATVVVGAISLAILLGLRFLAAEGAGGAARGRRRDRGFGGARPRRRRRRGRRHDPLRPPGAAYPVAVAGGCAHAAPGRDRHLPRLLRRRSPHGALLRGQARPAHPRRPGAARHGRGAGGRRRHPGPADRRQRLTDRGQRRDGRAQPDRRPAGRGGRRARAALPDRPDRRPAEGRARRDHRRRRGRARRAGGVAEAVGDRPRRARDRRR